MWKRAYREGWNAGQLGYSGRYNPYRPGLVKWRQRNVHFWIDEREVTEVALLSGWWRRGQHMGVALRVKSGLPASRPRNKRWRQLKLWDFSPAFWNPCSFLTDAK